MCLFLRLWIHFLQTLDFLLQLFFIYYFSKRNLSSSFRGSMQLRAEEQGVMLIAQYLPKAFVAALLTTPSSSRTKSILSSY
uniref:Uncharacterized protein n=1 Tax=Utricularia reniformis TaxID=192314 RepID=A0A1Y0B2A6_9LAMI|nr:hypothetical protein AEK19_MT1380 [Utricularia reniformis]ART31576.1 hypothetical protein AEK19_MT1380 [Utricularia reniformis]